jgi:hypothetical protein
MGLETLLITILGTATVTLSLTLLPAVIELAHPKDAGPRFISDTASVKSSLPVVDIEGDYQFIKLALPTVGNSKLVDLEGSYLNSNLAFLN